MFTQLEKLEKLLRKYEDDRLIIMSEKLIATRTKYTIIYVGYEGEVETLWEVYVWTNGDLDFQEYQMAELIKVTHGRKLLSYITPKSLDKHLPLSFVRKDQSYIISNVRVVTTIDFSNLINSVNDFTFAAIGIEHAELSRRCTCIDLGHPKHELRIFVSKEEVLMEYVNRRLYSDLQSIEMVLMYITQHCKSLF